MFNQLFNTQLGLFKDCLENKAIQKTKVGKQVISLVVNSSKNYSVSPRNPVTKNFCEYYRANVNECRTREFSYHEIMEIWRQFCDSLCNCVEFQYSFKSIFMCIRTVNDFTLIEEGKRKHYIKTVSDLMNSEQQFCYFINQIHFCHGDCSKDKNVKLLKEANFFNDLQRSRFYGEIQHSIPTEIKQCFFSE